MNNSEKEKALYKDLMDAIQIGNLKWVTQLLIEGDKKNNIKLDIHYQADEALRNACAYGHLEIVQFLLSGKELKEHASINAYSSQPLIMACANKHVSVVEYLLSSSKLKKKADINAQRGEPLFKACYGGSLDLVRFLLNSPKLKKHADIHIQGDRALINAAQGGHIHIAQYLTSSPELTEHCDIFVLEPYKFQYKGDIQQWIKSEQQKQTLQDQTNKENNDHVFKNKEVIACKKMKIL